MDAKTSLKRRFQQALRSTAVLHEKGAGGLRVALQLTKILDDQIRETYTQFVHPAKSSFSLVALGGYGRKELCFASDTDIMFLVPQGNKAVEAGFAVQKLLHQLLDLGLDIGHSVRTVADCLKLQQSDLEAWVSLLESRFLGGNKNLFQEFRRRLQQQIKEGDKALVTGDLARRTEDRHGKYGNSARLLEPNIKNSAGGLRDLHSILWLALASGVVPMPARPGDRHTAVTQLFASPWLRRRLPPHLRRDALEAFDFLLRTRNAMHLRSRGLHDSLEFAFHRTVAESLNFKSAGTRSSVERFMQEYYVSSRAVAQCTRRAAGAIQRRFASTRGGNATPLDDFFILRDGRIHPRRLRPISNLQLLKAFLLRVQHNAPFSDELEDLISRGLKAIKPLKSKAESVLFRSLLNEKQNVSAAVQELNDTGVLGRWIPEWKSLIAFFQHDQYHYYTADEHTLRVLGNAESLSADSSSFGETFRHLPRRDTLYLACLLHDIGKPHRVGGHEVMGASLAGKVLRRLKYGDILRDVEFLVRNHLAMEQVAFRRNLSDPQTIIDFAAKFKNPLMLDYLYVLTYADLSAVNRNVWTDWKGMLLFELYKKSREILDQKLTSSQVHDAARNRHTKAVKDLVQTLSDAIPRESSQNHLDAVDSSAYVAAFDPNEIAEHIRQIERNEPVATIFRNQANFTEVTIIARDAPFALSRFCGVLSANDANIIDANVFTRNDGIIIDKFRVTDFLSHTGLDDEQCRKIHSELIDVITGKVKTENLLERHRMKWRRLTRAQNFTVRTAIEFEEHPRYTIIDVFAPDRLGFLYKITEAMSSLNLNISFAKIATRADGIVDSFYILDEYGKPVTKPEQREEIRTALLRTIRELSESELVTT
ncbi:MAG: [protein-PII] uridylyltransferase [Ignavibacteriales bacterium]|nr:[protein-PII] uridylyltransferase [Ignavibacteriales bacterium]